ncbi:MAG: Uma2 family endonuclease [Gemmataceae bacterium]|nr:Uma2 family endonuclease [Gemmataceae bacterium]
MPVRIELALPASDFSSNQLHRFTVEEYRRMAAEGILSEASRVELLLEGVIVKKMTRNPPHDFTLQRLNRWLSRVVPQGWDWCVQSAITLADSEPEPDISLVRFQDDGYKRSHPTASDTALAIEIAEASLRENQTRKARIYAQAGIDTYWIVNLPARRVEALSEPSFESRTYMRTAMLAEADILSLVLDGVPVASFAVADLLP